MVADAESWYPLVLLDELIVRDLWIELREYIEAQRERNQRENKRRVPNGPLFALHQNEQRAEQRQEYQPCQQAAAHQRTTR